MAARADPAVLASLPGDNVETCFSHSAPRFSRRAGSRGVTSNIKCAVRVSPAGSPP